MAYDSTNKKVYTTDTQGISTSEVAACLGDGRITKRGRDIGLLCTSPKINKWAKYKPVPDSTKAPLKKKTMGYRGNNGTGTCGISYVTYGQYDVMGGLVSDDVNVSGRQKFGDLVKARTDDHTYAPPKGGLSEPFRLLDFDGYDHKALSIWNVIYPAIGEGKPSDVNFSQFIIGSYAYLKNISHSSPASLTLIDIMQGLKSDSTLVLYKMSDMYDIYNYSFSRDYDVDNSKSYGYIGCLATVCNANGTYTGVGFCSKSVGAAVGDNLNSFDSDIEQIMDAIGAVPNGKLMLVPVVCNYSTGGEWVVFALEAMTHFKAIPLPLAKEWYREYNLKRKKFTIISTTLSAYPTTTQIEGNLVYAPNASSGGLTLGITEAVTGTLHVTFRQGTTTLGSVNKSVTAGASSFNLGTWASGTTGLFYEATKKSTGLYAQTSGGAIFIDLAYSAGGSLSNWAEEVYDWAGGDSRIIVMR